jgi:hypothetical protein
MDNKTPNMVTGKRGPLWCQSLLRAQRKGAVIVSDETGQPVKYKVAHPHGSSKAFRAWVAADGGRYDARECHPVWS